MKILVVDDNRSSAEAMSRILRKQGHEVTTLYDGAAAIEELQNARPDLVFTDLRMEPVGGMDVLRAARSLTPPAEVVVFTAFGAVDKAVEAMRMGARDFLTKPISVEQILDRVNTLPASGEPAEFEGPPVTATLRDQLEALADVPLPVWIEGEVGTGRIRAAHQLHALSSGGPFHVVDPTSDAPWPTGTVVLPDVDDLGPEAQQALIRRLKRLPNTTRVVSTARPGTQERVANGSIRSDLYFTLAVVVVRLAPLRERPDEVVGLFEDALDEACKRYARTRPEVDAAARDALVTHAWPGNLKELHNLAERMAVLGPAGFSLQASPQAPAASPPTVSSSLFTDDFKLSDHLERIEADLLKLALTTADGDRTQAGRLLGVERNTLRYKLKKYGLLD